MKKKSIRRSAKEFEESKDEILEFLVQMELSKPSHRHMSFLYDLAIIRLYRAFEQFVLDCLTALLNNDSNALSEKTGVSFPKHINVEVCEYLIVGDGYFDFNARSGLIKTLKRYLPDDHWFVLEVKNTRHTNHLDRLSALRNFAAHGSSVSKRAALLAVDQRRMGSAGSWLKLQGRFGRIANGLSNLASNVYSTAQF